MTTIVIGAGSRGSSYANYALDFPQKFKVVGVAEPRKFYREKMQKQHNIPANQLFTDWLEAAAVDKFADCVIISTQDQLHKDPAVAFAKKGYHIFLEKPMAVSYADCCEIVAACKTAGVVLAVCHVLRYMPQAREITKLIQSGCIGDVVNIQHTEPVGYWHFAHSFVRGNWRSTKSSTFSLLAKSCHDLDLIQMWMGDKRCLAISSFGSLKHFTAANKPYGASSRCISCAVEPTCPFSAKKIYLSAAQQGRTGWPLKIIAEVPDIESVTEAIRTGPYGRCVYDCDNDVVDHQVVNMQFDGGATVSFTMIAFTERICERQTKIFGTKGELTCDFSRPIVTQYDFLQQKHFHHNAEDDFGMACGTQMRGHGGADFFAIDAFVHAVSTGEAGRILTGPEESLRSHLLCFAAEKSRTEHRVIDLTCDEIAL